MSVKQRKDSIEPEFAETKFKELVRFIAQECDDDPYFGAVKLNKILYLSPPSVLSCASQSRLADRTNGGGLGQAEQHFGGPTGSPPPGISRHYN